MSGATRNPRALNDGGPQPLSALSESPFARMLLAAVSAAVFALFTLAPLTSLLAGGFPASAPTKVDFAKVSWWSMLGTDPAYRTDIARRTVSNSPVGLTANGLNAALQLGLFGYIDRANVISGREGWLFYKLDWFYTRDCLPDATIAAALGRMEALHLVAAADGIDLRFAIAPDKSVLFPQMLTAQARVQSGCALQNAMAWRQMAVQRGTPVIDHLQAYQDYSTAPPASLYYPRNSHWTDLGTVRAMRQLVEAYLGDTVPAPTESDGQGVATRASDLGELLAMTQDEHAAKYDGWWMGKVVPKLAHGVRNAVIVHDSFYASAPNYLGTIFPGFKNRDFRFDNAALAADVGARPSAVLVSQVERILFSNSPPRDDFRGAAFWEGP